jgi:catechol 2,3-dioxygenase-like lactoylglutathione lyase family enzyme
MADFDFVILYVDSSAASAEFYSGLLGKPIVQQSPGFAVLPLRDGVMLGLWLKNNVEPKVAAGAGAGIGELGFNVSSDEAVTTTFKDWTKRGLAIAQEPVKMNFGFTFTALDPDGHRLRVYNPAR